MRLKSMLLPVFICFFSICGQAQDTLSLFYATAKFKLTETNCVKLDAFFQSCDLAVIDSIQIIGVADSSGNIASNFKLSLRRADHVFGYANEKYLTSKKVRLLAKGEDPAVYRSMEMQRRVDVILFYPAEKWSEPARIEEEITEDDGSCYVSADDILIGCRQTVVRKGKRSYVELEMEPAFYNESVKLYTVSEDPAKGTPVLHRVKWKAVMTGESWWKKKRYVATVNKEEFDRLRLVKKSELPCDSVPCGFRLSDREVRFNTDDYTYIDAFLMSNIKVKKKLFSRKKFKLEVPKIYVDLSRTYYLDESRRELVEWHTKRGRRHKDYYYATIKIEPKSNHTIGVYRQYTGDCITKNPLYEEGDRFRMPCGPQSREIPLSFGVEIGDRNVNPTHFAYAGLYLKYRWEYAELNLLAAYDTKKNFSLSLRYDYHFLGLSQGKLYLHYPPYQQRGALRLYGGTTMNILFPDAITATINQDLHLGIDFTKWHNRFQPVGIERIYLEGGAMIDYSRMQGPLVPQFRLGLQFRLL